MHEKICKEFVLIHSPPVELFTYSVVYVVVTVEVNFSVHNQAGFNHFLTDTVMMYD